MSIHLLSPFLIFFFTCKGKVLTWHLVNGYLIHISALLWLPTKFMDHDRFNIISIWMCSYILFYMMASREIICKKHFFFLIAVKEHMHSTASFHFKFVLNSSGWCGHSNPYTHLWWRPQTKVIVCMNLAWYDGLLQPNNHCPCNNNCWGCRSITASVHEWHHVWRNVIMSW